MEGLDVDVEPDPVLFAKLIAHRLALDVKAELDGVVWPRKPIQVALERYVAQAVFLHQFDILGVEVGLGLETTARKEEVAEEV